jgi:hypothetical protein
MFKIFNNFGKALVGQNLSLYMKGFPKVLIATGY